jgi:HSP20 family protein
MQLNRAVAGGFSPPAEVLTDGDDVNVRLELPGIDVDKDVQVELDKTDS